MKVLVLGGTGFIGAEVVKLLFADRHDVAVFHRGETTPDFPAAVHTIAGNRFNLAKSAKDFEKFAPEIVVDMIAGSQQQARDLMSAFDGIAKRVVVISSADVYRSQDVLYGREPGPIEPVPIREDAPLRKNLYPYRSMKMPMVVPYLDFEHYDKILVEEAVKDHPQLPATILRLPMVYGPGDHDYLRRFFPYLKRMWDHRTSILLNDKTANWRSTWGYVTNVAHAIRMAVENERATGATYNVAESESLTIADWVRELASTVGWTGKLVITSRACPPPSMPSQFNLDQHFFTDSGKIRKGNASIPPPTSILKCSTMRPKMQS